MASTRTTIGAQLTEAKARIRELEAENDRLRGIVAESAAIMRTVSTLVASIKADLVNLGKEKEQ